MIEEALLTREEVDFLANLSAFMAEFEGGKGESDGSALSELSTST